MSIPDTPVANVTPTASQTDPEARLAPGSALVIGLLMVSTFIVLLNEMLLGVALPTLIVDFGITPSTGQWVTTGYLLTLAVLIPATGYVMRRFHLRTIFLGALSLFTVGTAIAALAPAIEVLLAGRIVQAAGTAVFMPLLMTTTMRLVPAGRRGHTMALVTGLTAVAPAVGPAVSGVVLSQLNWRWLFILVLPITLAALALGAMKLRNIITPEQATLDILSLVLSAVGFGSLVYGLASIGESVSGHAPIPPYLPITVGLAGIAAFVYRQVVLQRHRDAFLDMRIFGTRSFTVPLLVMVIVALNGFGTLIVLPLVLTHVVGLSTFAIGLFLVPGGALIAIVSGLGGRVYDRFGPRPLAIPGAVVWTASLWFLSQMNGDTSVVTILMAYLVLSASQALMWAPMTTTALASLRADLYPHGTAAFTTIQQLAGAAGGAVLISAYTIGAKDAGALGMAESVSAAQATFTTAGVFAIVAVLGVLFVPKAPSAH
ncbi:DHA2 family efflux MFS transporter permease subunit [Rhodococcus sp. IEGM 1307]|uniref:DHA2 family efflux MFS transporter permease subunit n=1 Tax=Rhodococcus sp. IEGM 1307 TaxID=3047091 RepID=UPI0024B87654|nr:DHA2 family efflux MFS transporter permease subunit [Rhodococcus sp. IEGM 1307]MDI9977221.1 DHA2 family efflux MFS transporter permease subunit [Rhodococcus sp. IEGM 1307]